MKEMVEEECKKKNITFSSLRKILSDHSRPPSGHDETVCRHTDSRLFDTLSSVYLNPKEMKIGVSDGNPCQGAPLRSYNVAFNYKIPNFRYLRRDSKEDFYDPLF